MSRWQVWGHGPASANPGLLAEYPTLEGAIAFAVREVWYTVKHNCDDVCAITVVEVAI